MLERVFGLRYRANLVTRVSRTSIVLAAGLQVAVHVWHLVASALVCTASCPGRLCVSWLDLIDLGSTSVYGYTKGNALLAFVPVLR